MDATPPNQGGELHARIFSITPTTKFVMAGYVLAIIAAFLLVAVVSVFIPAVSAFIAVLIGLLLLLIPAYFHIREKLTRYSLTDTTIEIDKGLISRTTQNIPLRRIQDVTVSATLLQRLLGYGDITIDNASEDGGKVVLDNVDSPRKYADHVLRQMRLLDK
ncbi:MAG: PH domain-containing protein [Blastocatellia bacterium]